MKKLILLAMALALSACGDHPVPSHGTVIDHNYTPAWIQYIPGYTTCSGNPPSCYTTPPTFIPYPDEWSITIRDLNNPDWQGTVTDGDSHAYDLCPVGSRWPECWGGK